MGLSRSMKCARRSKGFKLFSGPDLGKLMQLPLSFAGV